MDHDATASPHREQVVIGVPSWFHGETRFRLSFLILCRVRAYVAMCALGIDKLRQHAAEILLLRRHAEQDSFVAHFPVKNLDIGDSETQFDFSCWVLTGSRVQSESRFARHELAPPRRLELDSQTEHIAIDFTALFMSATN